MEFDEVAFLVLMVSHLNARMNKLTDYEYSRNHPTAQTTPASYQIFRGHTLEAYIDYHKCHNSKVSL